MDELERKLPQWVKSNLGRAQEVGHATAHLNELVDNIPPMDKVEETQIAFACAEIMAAELHQHNSHSDLAAVSIVDCGHSSEFRLAGGFYDTVPIIDVPTILYLKSREIEKKLDTRERYYKSISTRRVGDLPILLQEYRFVFRTLDEAKAEEPFSKNVVIESFPA